jgi:hypothetical protein
MDFVRIHAKSKQFLSLTSLYPEEFDRLLVVFRDRWYKFYKQYTLEGNRRKSPYYKYRNDTPTLPTVEDKLFFVLMMLKNNSTQELIAASFDLDQSKASRWFALLLPLLNKTLKKLDLQPARTTEELKSQLRKARPEDDKVYLDASERPIGRITDQEAQKKDYSGKKHCHTVKNNLMSLSDQEIIYLGPTYRGAIHDKKMADLEQYHFDPNLNLWVLQDKGYDGLLIAGAHTMQPFKARRNHPLTKIQKEFNHWVSKQRIVIEHAISGIKRAKMASHVCRLAKSMRDAVMLACTSLHNFRVRSPQRKYSPARCYASA